MLSVMNKTVDATQFIGQRVDVVIDRALGTKHPKCDMVYEVNYGYIPEVFSADGDELDAYVLGVDTPIEKFTGICIAVFDRLDDNEDKLVVVPEGMTLTPEEIESKVEFQEKWFKHNLVMLEN